MHSCDLSLLATDLCATTGLPVEAARLLMRLSENGPVASALLSRDEDRRALAALLACGAAEDDGATVRHRPRSWCLRRLAVRGVFLAVQVCGEGEALVLAPAFGTYRCLWGNPWTRGPNQLVAFSESYQTICIDYRGTGCSDITDEPYSLEGFAADLDAALDRLQVERAHLLGVSLGGAVVLRMALARPERVASLVLCASTAGELDETTRAKAQMFLRVMAERPLEWAIRTYLRTPLAAATPQTVGALAALGRRSVRTLDNFLNLYHANVFRAGLRHRLCEVRAPTLVLVGEEDLPYFQEEARVLARGIAAAELVSVPAAGHVACQQNPTFFNRAVLEFLARHRTARAGAGLQQIVGEARA